ncbi:translation initiation factor IF-2 subunit beta [Candidatus Pacearchaeota archaeon CG10_big_fil_rev_8_21_14_0_10_32_42]|nr:MAG: translation initiation factor IF-2 subunit beta [Candidatus Pacearchaeota archaeon CG10_big_fil_rev_8_21_14_0_10_32_42]
MKSYEELLDEAYEKVKIIEGTGERFEIPGIEGHFEGKKTILTNFFHVASSLRRNPDHLLKFLTKELAAKGIIQGDRIILNMKVSSKKINPKIEQYVEEFVLCKECKKPDTEIVKEGKFTMLQCLACGAKHPIQAKI